MAYRDSDNYGDPNDPTYNYTDPPIYAQDPNLIGGPAAAPPPAAAPAPAPAPSGIHTEWFGGGGPQGQYSRGLEDAFLNYASTYTGPKDAASLGGGFGQ